MNLTLKNKFKIIFLLVPLNYLIDFSTFTIFHIHIDLWSYIIITQMLLIAYWFKNQRIINILLLIYVIIYALSYTTGYPLTNKVRYMLIFVSTISIMWLVIKNRNQIVIVSSKDKFFEIFSIFFITIFALSIPFVIPNSEVDNRLYLNGFLAPHHFAYYTAILGYFCLSRKKTILGLIILGFGVLSGSRTGVILAFLSLLFSFNNVFSVKSFLLFLFSVIIVLTISYFSFNEFIKTQLGYFQGSFSSATLSFDAYSQKSFTSYRSIVWLNLLNDFLKNPLDLYNFIGHGPKSSMSFNETKLGVAIWMHNDFFDIFYCYGYVGLSLFTYSIYKLIKSTKSFFLLIFILISSNINGFMTYDVTQILLVATIVILGKVNSNRYKVILTPKNKKYDFSNHSIIQ